MLAELIDYGLGLDERLCPEATTLDPSTEFQAGRFYGTATSPYRETAGRGFPAKYASNPDEVLVGSYGLNGWTMDFDDPAAIDTGTNYTLAEVRAWAYSKPDQVPDPTAVPWFGDSTWRISWPAETDSGSTDPQIPWPGNSESSIKMWQMDRHINTINNISFADGHAEPVNVDDLDQLRWHNNWPTEGSVNLDTNWP